MRPQRTPDRSRSANTCRSRRAALEKATCTTMLSISIYRVLAAALIAAPMSVWADHGSAEPPLTADDKARLQKTLADAVRDGYISDKQYQQSVGWLNSAPCIGVDRGLTGSQKNKLEAAIQKQQHLSKVTVYASFRASDWSVVFSDASVGDSPYFFYSADPLQGSPPVATWSGGAAIFETTEVADWVKRNVRGIPEQLANCFAWHVTLSPE